MPCSPWRGTELRKDGAGAPLKCVEYMKECEGCLEITRVYLQTHQKSSEQVKTAGKCHTHLVEVQNRMQRSLTDTLGTRNNVQSVRNNATTTAIMPRNVSLLLNRLKLPNLLVGVKTRCIGDAEVWKTLCKH